MALHSKWTFWPSASTRSETTLMPFVTAASVATRLFGAGPGEYVDFAAFNFHVAAKTGFAGVCVNPAMEPSRNNGRTRKRKLRLMRGLQGKVVLLLPRAFLHSRIGNKTKKEAG